MEASVFLLLKIKKKRYYSLFFVLFYFICLFFL
jgi:hypothetical protein